MLKFFTGKDVHSVIFLTSIIFSFSCIASCNNHPSGRKGSDSSVIEAASGDEETNGGTVDALLVMPRNPLPGETFRILAVGDKKIHKADIIAEGPSGTIRSLKTEAGNQLPYWRIDDFKGSEAGKYRVTLKTNKKDISIEFAISAEKEGNQANSVWKSIRGWDSSMEAIYSAWVNALFNGYGEDATWSSLSEVTQNREKNFLYNYLSLNEDEADTKNNVKMQPDCADNPFFLRAYFSWKLGLPFGYHVCDRGSLNRKPGTGEWVTNETSYSKTGKVSAFNAFLRQVMNGVHSGTARTSLDNENSDYYPVPLNRESLRPGTVYADPYGHTLIIVGWIQQTNGHPGQLLSVDAQPDGTVGIKRFWKGNFLFNTTDVVGEPGFKAFRPIILQNGKPVLLKNRSLTAAEGFVPFSLQQRKMGSDVFYHDMEKLINLKPLDPESELLNLIQALHEQLQVRVISVENGEKYFRAHPGAVIPMPSNANGIFQAGGQWEDFSTPNRDLRLLIAMDAVMNFPDQVATSPDDYNISKLSSPENIRKKLLEILEDKTSELSITYTRSDGSSQKLTIAEILKRKEAFEMAYNPNDGAEIRWGAPENSNERSTCRRHVPAGQLQTMRSVRNWFNKRLHPPT